MSDIENIKTNAIYEHFKCGRHTLYDEEKHCKLLIKIMINPDKGTLSAFCVEAIIHLQTFYNWIEKHDILRNVYYFCQMIARETWEEEGRKLRDAEFQMGTVNYSMDYWKLIGWSRFGISKNPRIKMNFKEGDNPAQHYAAILRQAAEGDFTASEFKQLMEAVNVGINVHQLFELQNQIDELKSALAVMEKNTNVKNPFSNKGTAKKD